MSYYYSFSFGSVSLGGRSVSFKRVMRIGRDELGNVGQTCRHSWRNLAAADKDEHETILRLPNRQPHSSKALVVDVPDMGQPKFHEPGECGPGGALHLVEAAWPGKI